VFATVTTGVAVAGHWLGCGMVVGFLPALTAVGVASLVGWLLVPRRSGRTVVVTSVVIQLVMHMGFAASMASGKFGPMSLILCGQQHMNMSGMSPGSTMVMPRAGVLAELLSRQGLPMLGAHLAAAAVSGMWMHGGEELVTALAQAAALWCVELLIWVLVPAVSHHRRTQAWLVGDDGLLSLRGRAVGGSGLRGPPRESCA
jgi:hypothetical protein